MYVNLLGWVPQLQLRINACSCMLPWHRALFLLAKQEQTERVSGAPRSRAAGAAAARRARLAAAAPSRACPAAGAPATQTAAARARRTAPNRRCKQEARTLLTCPGACCLRCAAAWCARTVAAPKLPLPQAAPRGDRAGHGLHAAARCRHCFLAAVMAGAAGCHTGELRLQMWSQLWLPAELQVTAAAGTKLQLSLLTPLLPTVPLPWRPGDPEEAAVGSPPRLRCKQCSLAAGQRAAAALQIATPALQQPCICWADMRHAAWRGSAACASKWAGPKRAAQAAQCATALLGRP